MRGRVAESDRNVGHGRWEMGGEAGSQEVGSEYNAVRSVRSTHRCPPSRLVIRLVVDLAEGNGAVRSGIDCRRGPRPGTGRKSAQLSWRALTRTPNARLGCEGLDHCQTYSSLKQG